MSEKEKEQMKEICGMYISLTKARIAKIAEMEAAGKALAGCDWNGVAESIRTFRDILQIYKELEGRREFSVERSSMQHPLQIADVSTETKDKIGLILDQYLALTGQRLARAIQREAVGAWPGEHDWYGIHDSIRIVRDLPRVYAKINCPPQGASNGD